MFCEVFIQNTAINVFIYNVLDTHSRRFGLVSFMPGTKDANTIPDRSEHKRIGLNDMKLMKITQYVAVAAVSSMAAFSASAINVYVDRLSPYSGGLGGGEFTIGQSPWGANYGAKAQASFLVPNATGFQTFCLEGNESAGYGWSDASLSDGAVGGGFSGGNPDPICLGTAWLYSEFAKGVLVGYDYTAAGRQASALDLQKTIWWLEGEMADPGALNPFRNAVMGLANYTDDAGLNNVYNVLVVNMTSIPKPGAAGPAGQPVLKQSMLVMVPDGGMTLALLGGALFGLGVMRRKV